jgi:hypothetical protein
VKRQAGLGANSDPVVSPHDSLAIVVNYAVIIPDLVESTCRFDSKDPEWRYAPVLDRTSTGEL